MSRLEVWLWIGAAATALLGLAVIAWAVLIGDRSRGRRRCAKCWYDMAGLPGLTCPECGRTAKHERGLHRRRRRWRWAMVGLSVLAVSGAPAAWRVREKGWQAAPTIVLIAVWPWATDPSAITWNYGIRPVTTRKKQSIDEVLYDRVHHGLPQWEAILLARRCLGRLGPEDDPATRMFAMAIIEDLQVGGCDLMPVYSSLRRLIHDQDSGIRERAFWLALHAATAHRAELLSLWKDRYTGATNLKTKWMAAIALSSFVPEGRCAIPTLMEIHTLGQIAEITDAALALARLGPPATVLPVLRGSLTSGNEKIAAGDAWALGNMGKEAEPAVTDLIDLVLDRTRSWHFEQDGAAVKEFPVARNAAARSLGLIGGRAVAAIPVLAAAAKDDRRLADTCDASIRQLGGDAKAGAAALLVMVEYGQIERRADAVRVVAECGVRTAEVVEAAKRLRNTENAEVRKWAAKILEQPAQ